jgi:hypothetical protein
MKDFHPSGTDPDPSGNPRGPIAGTQNLFRNEGVFRRSIYIAHLIALGLLLGLRPDVAQAQNPETLPNPGVRPHLEAHREVLASLERQSVLTHDYDEAEAIHQERRVIERWLASQRQEGPIHTGCLPPDEWRSAKGLHFFPNQAEPASGPWTSASASLAPEVMDPRAKRWLLDGQPEIRDFVLMCQEEVTEIDILFGGQRLHLKRPLEARNEPAWLLGRWPMTTRHTSMVIIPNAGASAESLRSLTLFRVDADSELRERFREWPESPRMPAADSTTFPDLVSKLFSLDQDLRLTLRHLESRAVEKGEYGLASKAEKIAKSLTNSSYPAPLPSVAAVATAPASPSGAQTLWPRPDRKPAPGCSAADAKTYAGAVMSPDRAWVELRRAGASARWDLRAPPGRYCVMMIAQVVPYANLPNPKSTPRPSPTPSRPVESGKTNLLLVEEDSMIATNKAPHQFSLGANRGPLAQWNLGTWDMSRGALTLKLSAMGLDAENSIRIQQIHLRPDPAEAALPPPDPASAAALPAATQTSPSTPRINLERLRKDLLETLRTAQPSVVLPPADRSRPVEVVGIPGEIRGLIESWHRRRLAVIDEWTVRFKADAQTQSDQAAAARDSARKTSVASTLRKGLAQSADLRLRNLLPTTSNAPAVSMRGSSHQFLSVESWQPGETQRDIPFQPVTAAGWYEIQTSRSGVFAPASAVVPISTVLTCNDQVCLIPEPAKLLQMKGQDFGPGMTFGHIWLDPEADHLSLTFDIPQNFKGRFSFPIRDFVLVPLTDTP